MATQIVKWLGTNIEEDTTHRLVTDEQIERWDTNPDWNENDESSAGYIKNRTHYVGEKCTLIFETEYTGITEYNNENLATIPTTYKWPDWDRSTAPDGDYITGSPTYVVIYDGVEYRGLTWKYRHFSQMNMSYLGNSSLATRYGENWPLIDNEDQFPFLIRRQYTADQVDLLSDDSETHTIALYELEEEIHTLDEKYIPDTIARVINNIEITSATSLDSIAQPGEYTMSYSGGYYGYNSETECNDYPFLVKDSSLTVTKSSSGRVIQRVFDTYDFYEYIRVNANPLDEDNGWSNKWGDWAKIEYQVDGNCLIQEE